VRSRQSFRIASPSVTPITMFVFPMSMQSSMRTFRRVMRSWKGLSPEVPARNPRSHGKRTTLEPQCIPAVGMRAPARAWAIRPLQARCAPASPRPPFAPCPCPWVRCEP
jgi:hypothetical protein